VVASEVRALAGRSAEVFWTIGGDGFKSQPSSKGDHEAGSLLTNFYEGAGKLLCSVYADAPPSTSALV
jgi:hypothetical protein